MIQLGDIHPVADFTRRTKEYIQRLKETGNPEVLTVNGQAEMVVQSAGAYQELLNQAEFADALLGIKRGLEEAGRGDVRPARGFLASLAAKHGIVRNKC